jgi:hypothetical protein
VLDVACFLLEVMRLQEHALRPDDPACPTHGAGLTSIWRPWQ